MKIKLRKQTIITAGGDIRTAHWQEPLARALLGLRGSPLNVEIASQGVSNTTKLEIIREHANTSAPFPNYALYNYFWRSTDGRVLDELHINGPFDRRVVMEIIALLVESGLELRCAEDLTIQVWGEDLTREIQLRAGCELHETSWKTELRHRLESNVLSKLGKTIVRLAPAEMEIWTVAPFISLAVEKRLGIGYSKTKTAVPKLKHVSYWWESTDGHSLDKLCFSGPFNRLRLERLISHLVASGLQLRSSYDLLVFLRYR